MLYTEWNWDDALAVRAEESWQEGREEGFTVGIAKGREEGVEEGLTAGLAKGREEGREEGQNMILELMKQGYSAAKIEAFLAESRSAGAEIAGN